MLYIKFNSTQALKIKILYTNLSINIFIKVSLRGFHIEIHSNLNREIRQHKNKI